LLIDVVVRRNIVEKHRYNRVVYEGNHNIVDEWFHDIVHDGFDNVVVDEVLSRLSHYIVECLCGAVGASAPSVPVP
jgi:hypothetical protein